MSTLIFNYFFRATSIRAAVKTDAMMTARRAWPAHRLARRSLGGDGSSLSEGGKRLPPSRSPLRWAQEGRAVGG